MRRKEKVRMEVKVRAVVVAKRAGEVRLKEVNEAVKEEGQKVKEGVEENARENEQENVVERVGERVLANEVDEGKTQERLVQEVNVQANGVGVTEQANQELENELEAEKDETERPLKEKGKEDEKRELQAARRVQKALTARTEQVVVIQLRQRVPRVEKTALVLVHEKAKLPTTHQTWASLVSRRYRHVRTIPQMHCTQHRLPLELNSRPQWTHAADLPKNHEI